VAGGEAVTVQVRETRFGPVINDLLGMETPMAARMVAAEPGRSMEVIYWLPRAQNWEEFQAGVALFDFTGQNFVYADVEGNIGVVSGGRMPLRVEGHDGTLPMAGVDASFEWLGFLDKAENPRVFNPEAGFIVASNNAFARPEDLPTPMAVYYDFGYRARRAEQLIMAQEVHSVESMMAIQTDNFNPAGEILIPTLLGLDFGDPALNELRDWLGEWDYMNDADSGQAALFNAFWLKILPLAFDELAPAGGVSGDSRDMYVMAGMMQAQSPLWRNAELGIDNRDEQLKLAFGQAVEMLTAELGPDYQVWRWDAIHISYPRHAPLGQLPLGANPTLDTFIPTLNRYFNREVGVDGGTASINNQRWDARRGDFYLSGGVVSMRMIIDFSNLDNSKFTRELGQVGSPLSPHFDDMTPFWVNGDYRPYGFTPEAVAAITVRTLNFSPAE
jgi:penicillin amidase